MYHSKGFDMFMKKKILIFAMKCLTAAYLLTGLLLLLLAMLLFKLHLSEKVVNVCIVLIYILVCFLAGLITGKKAIRRRFLWGGLMGAFYFLILFVISMIVSQSFPELTTKFGSTFLLCSGSGMLGGMISG